MPARGVRAGRSIPEIIVVAARATVNEPAPVLVPSDSSLLYQAGTTSTMAVAYVVDPREELIDF